MDALNSAVEGMSQAQAQLDSVASKVARSGPSTPPSQGDTVDLSAEAAALIQARTSFEANASVALTAESMTQSLLDTLR